MYKVNVSPVLVLTWGTGREFISLQTALFCVTAAAPAQVLKPICCHSFSTSGPQQVVVLLPL